MEMAAHAGLGRTVEGTPGGAQDLADDTGNATSSAGPAGRLAPELAGLTFVLARFAAARTGTLQDRCGHAGQGEAAEIKRDRFDWRRGFRKSGLRVERAPGNGGRRTGG
jgi:hypothetical protein